MTDRSRQQELIHAAFRQIFDPIIAETAKWAKRWARKHHKPTRMAYAQRSRFHRKRPRF